MTNRILRLPELGKGFPGITAALGQALFEACIVCLIAQKHVSGVLLEVKGSFEESFELHWADAVTEQMLRAWNDEAEATEQAACGIAILLAISLTELTVIERSRKGTGFDYWLGSAMSGETNIFENKARLEVSRIRNALSGEITARITQKKRQVAQFESKTPAYIVVVDFGGPVAHMVRL